MLGMDDIFAFTKHYGISIKVYYDDKHELYEVTMNIGTCYRMLVIKDRDLPCAKELIEQEALSLLREAEQYYKYLEDFKQRCLKKGKREKVKSEE